MGIYLFFAPVQENRLIINENDIRHLHRALKTQSSDMKFASYILESLYLLMMPWKTPLVCVPLVASDMTQMLKSEKVKIS